MTWLQHLARRLWPSRSRPGARIPDELWHALLLQHPFIAWRSQAELERLRELSANFLKRKEFHGAQGFRVSDEIALAVAAQACLPVLNLGLSAYDGFVGIVMHEGPVRARRQSVDEHGLVHDWEEELVGEAMGDGPVMLSWHDGAAPATTGHPQAAGAPDTAPSAPNDAARQTAFNVVIHEFVHLLDLLDGQFDGTPALPAAQRRHWQQVIQAAFDRFDERSACGYASVIDDYGAQDIGEFYAVSSEAFFTRPSALLEEQPELYALYAGFYRQDPARQEPRGQAVAGSALERSFLRGG